MFEPTLEKQGPLYIRTSKNEIYEANQLLSSVYIKYSPYKNVYHDITNNNIEKMDVIYDTLYIKTSSGCFFEKIYSDNNNIFPSNLTTSYYPLCTFPMDYWYSENKNKIYFIDVQDVYKNTIGSHPLSSFKFLFNFGVYNCSIGSVENLYKYETSIYPLTGSEWVNNLYIMKDPKLTYNTDTNLFNISFILKNYKNQLGIVSINLINNKAFDVSELNMFTTYSYPISSNNSYIRKLY